MFSVVFSEISADIKKIGRNLTAQGQHYCVSRGFAGGATLRLHLAGISIGFDPFKPIFNDFSAY